jgi:hypothetical protein
VTVGQIIALALLAPATLVAMIYTYGEVRDAWTVTTSITRRNFDAYEIAVGLLSVVVADAILAVAAWLVLR